MFVDTLLRVLGNNPAAYAPQDKWPTVLADLFISGLPIIFALLVIAPFFWLWHKKKKFTWRNIGVAILQSIGLVIVGIVALFFLFSFMLGQVFQAVNGI